MFVAAEPFDEMMVIFVEDTVGPGKVNTIMYACTRLSSCFSAEASVFLCLGVSSAICSVCRLKFWDKFEYHSSALNAA